MNHFFSKLNKMKNWTRRDWLKTLGLASLIPVSSTIDAENPVLIDLDDPDIFEFPHNAFHRPIEKPITCIVIGAGARGNTYSSYTERFKGEMNIIGVAEPNAIRRERFSKRYNIAAENQVNTWEDIFTRPKFADAVMITTPDHLHFGPAMKALELGYDLLLEKPIAQSWQECKAILDAAKKYNRIVAVCHVLRYTPYFRKMKEIIDSGVLGEIVSVQHFEPIEHVHMSHSYVRGIWRKEKETNPIILAKSCHDMDIMRWLIGKRCTTMASFGKLSHFKKENAPEGSTLRCTDGCKVEATCPFSALRIYYRERTWLYHFDLPWNEEQGPAIMKELTEGNYGRCVYHCDNDVPDHQVCMMEFEGGVTASFNMEALTSYHGRRTRIMGTKGDIVGDEEEMRIANFSTKKVEILKTADYAKITSGHGGGDYSLTRDFIQAVAHQEPKVLTSTIDLSMESHLMGFKAEESRHQERIVNVNIES
jgi:predicted dehydrogenase